MATMMITEAVQSGRPSWCCNNASDELNKIAAKRL